MTRIVERLLNKQGADSGVTVADRTEDESVSSTFGISGMDGFALTSQPRRAPALPLGHEALPGEALARPPAGQGNGLNNKPLALVRPWGARSHRSTTSPEAWKIRIAIARRVASARKMGDRERESLADKAATDRWAEEGSAFDRRADQNPA